MVRMNVKASPSKIGAAGGSPGDCGDPGIVLACEDFAAGMHALAILDEKFPGRGFGGDATTSSAWKFELLEVTSLRKLAVTAAAVAPIVVLSVHAPGELPKGVKLWLRDWMSNRGARPGELMLMLDGAGPHLNSSLALESDLAQRAGSAGLHYSIYKTSDRRGMGDFNFAGDARPGIGGKPPVGRPATGGQFSKSSCVGLR